MPWAASDPTTAPDTSIITAADAHASHGTFDAGARKLAFVRFAPSACR